MIKLVCFLKRNPALSEQEFRDHWRNVHGPLIADTPEIARHLVRYEQLAPTTYADWMGSPGYDGITIMWFTSAAEFEAMVAEPRYGELVVPDEASLLDGDGLVWMMTEEPHLVIDGPAA